jgi:outer membrane lipoprotein-sorting protein
MGKNIVFTGFVCSILAVCLVLSAGCVSTPTSASTPENLAAPVIAEKFVHQQDSLKDLSATVEITTEYTPPKDKFLMQKKSPYNYRIEFLLSGSEATGTLVMTNGTVIWWYSPLTKTVRTTPHFDPNVTWFTQSDYQKMVKDLFEHHPHAYNLNMTDVGNNSYVMVFSALPGEPFSNLPNEYQNARVWIDADLWIAKRIEFYNAAWPSPMIIEYTDIRVNNGIPDTTFVFDPLNVPNPPEEFRHHDPVVFLFTLEDAYHILGHDLVIPGYVPEGYSYEGGFQMGDRTLELSLVNGKQWVSYLDSPVIGKPYSEPFVGETSEVFINGTTGVFRTGIDKNQLQWIEGGHAYMITGMTDEQEMMRMATSLVHVDDQLMKTLPQNGIQMAEPLTVAELTSIIMPESWIRSHNNSTTPGIIDIRVAASEFNETFVKSTQYPNFLVYRNTSTGERVALYQVPKTMFAANNPDPAQVVLNHPESMFRYYPDLDAVFEDRCKYDQIPCPSGGATSHE